MPLPLPPSPPAHSPIQHDCLCDTVLSNQPPNHTHTSSKHQTRPPHLLRDHDELLHTRQYQHGHRPGPTLSAASLDLSRSLSRSRRLSRSCSLGRRSRHLLQLQFDDLGVTCELRTALGRRYRGGGRAVMLCVKGNAFCLAHSVEARQSGW